MAIKPRDLRVTRFDSFDDAAPAWRRLEDRGSFHGVQRFCWLAHWHATVGRGLVDQVCIVLVELAEQPLLLLPLGVIRFGPAACLTWLGGDITDYHGPVLSRDYSRRVTSEDFAFIWSAVHEVLPAHDAIRLHKQPERIGAQSNPFLNLPGSAGHAVNHWSLLEGTWDEFHSRQVRPRLRGDSRRKRRRLSEMGRLEFVVARSTEEMRTISECMIGQKVARYQSTGTYSLFNDDAYRSFFLEPSEALLESGMLHVSALRLDEHHLATHWGIVSGRRFYFIMAGFAEGEWKRYSPGRLLIEDLFRWCFEAGVDEFDFTIGDEAFKQIWSNRRSRLFRYIEARNLRGTAFTIRERCADWIRSRPVLHRGVSRLRNAVRR
jgi:CelD/BcsL family acetyltransferase involved in cellulose biosynthesis